VSKAGTILIATGDGVLADSLRFSLELEGFEAKLCDELSLLPALAASEAPGCVEKPLLGGVLLEAIRKAMGAKLRPGLGRLYPQSPST